MKIFRTLALATLLVAAASPLMANGQAEKDVAAASNKKFELLGAGASFPAPLLTAWADEYRTFTKGRVTVNYQSIGSGGGIRQFIEQTIMFGATESALNDKQMSDAIDKTAGLAFNLPLTLGDVVLTYNLPGIKKGLVFNAQTISETYLGMITRWNDPKIAALNPSVKLPNLPITIVHRSDGSGTTAVFTDYLSKVNTEWATKVGKGSSVKWLVGTGGNGNEGVAGVVQNTPGALGYNSLVYAVLNDIAYGSVINKSGTTVVPSLKATGLAAAVTIPADGRVSLTETTAKDGYPIAGFAWALVYENLDRNAAITDRDTAVQLVNFLYWVITRGQDINEGLSFARLPKDAQALAERMVSQLKFKGEAIGKQIVDRYKVR